MNKKGKSVCENKKTTGLFDRKGKEIQEGNRIKYMPDIYSDNSKIYIYKVCYGIGTFDGGAYQYVGFYLKDEDGNTDGNSQILFETDFIEIVQ